MNKKIWITGTVIALTLLVALAGATAAFAQRPTVLEAFNLRHFRDRVARFGCEDCPCPIDEETMHGLIAETLGISVEKLETALEKSRNLVDLAEELDITLEDVQAAVQAARSEAVQMALDEGDITQEQADRLLDRQIGKNHGLRGNRRYGGYGALCDSDCQGVIAETLGITLEELEAARAEGKTLADLADEQGLDFDEVRAATQTIREEALQQAVEEGRITQEQANQICSSEGRRRTHGRDRDNHPFDRCPFHNP